MRMKSKVVMTGLLTRVRVTRQVQSVPEMMTAQPTRAKAMRQARTLPETMMAQPTKDKAMQQEQCSCRMTMERRIRVQAITKPY